MAIATCVLVQFAFTVDLILNQNNNFVNPRRLPLLCGISETLYTYSTGGYYGRQAGNPIFSKFAIDLTGLHLGRVLASLDKLSPPLKF